MMNEPIEKTEKKPVGQLIYNIASAVAIVALFVLFFLKTGEKTSDPISKSDETPMNIAYVSSDSLMNSYALVDTLMAKLQRVNDSLEDDLTARQQQFQAKVMAYQQNLQNGTITTKQQAEQQEAALQAEQENLISLSDQYTSIIAVMQNQMNSQIIDSVQAIIKANPEKFPYDLVLGYTKGAGILYISKDLDITAEVVKMLNENFSH